MTASTSAPPANRRARAALGALAIGFALLVAACASLRQTEASSRTTERPRRARAVAPQPPQRDSDRVPVGASPARGPATAAVTVLEFGDFQCPYCARVQPTLARVRERYGSSLRVVWKHAPLSFHPHARAAANAAQEVYTQRGAAAFWRYHDTLFGQPEQLDVDALVAAAQPLGVDLGRLREAIATGRHDAAIDADRLLAARLGLGGTPAFVINGTLLEGARPVDEFVALVERARAAAARVSPPAEAYRVATAPVRLLSDEEIAARSRPRRPRRRDPDARYRVPVDGAPSRGPADALVTVVVFSDFQCPYCARVEPVLAALRARYGPRVRWVWRDFTLPGHDDAPLAAEAAREAFAQRGAAGFWRYHDALFARGAGESASLARPALLAHARALGLDPERFGRALDTHVHAAAVENDRALGEALGVSGTPAFFVNGRALVGARPEAEFAALIEREWAEARARRTRGTAARAVYAELMSEASATGPVYLPDDAPAPPPPHYALRPAPDAPGRGPLDAPVIVEMFGDYQCPFCARVMPTIERLLARYPRELRLTWRDYPLPNHPHAQLAAEAAREILAQLGVEGFWRAHARLFATFAEAGPPDLARLSSDLGLDLPRLRAALANHQHAASVRADVEAADATGADMGTPAFFVNGRLYQGARPLEDFVQAVELARREARQ